MPVSVGVTLVAFTPVGIGGIEMGNESLTMDGDLKIINNVKRGTPQMSDEVFGLFSLEIDPVPLSKRSIHRRR